MVIRPATTQDIDAVSKVYAESWRTTYEGFVPEAFLRGMTLEAAADVFRESLQNKEYCYFLYVAETPEGRMMGFTDGGKERGHPELGTGELYALYLLKEYQARGFGTRLFQTAVKSLTQSGMDSMVAWVMEKSPYRRFYEKADGRLVKGTKKLKWDGQSIPLVCYRWDGIKKMVFKNNPVST